MFESNNMPERSQAEEEYVAQQEAMVRKVVLEKQASLDNHTDRLVEAANKLETKVLETFEKRP